MNTKKIILIAVPIFILLAVACVFALSNTTTAEPIVEFYVNDNLIAEDEYTVHKIAWLGKEMPKVRDGGTVGENSLFNKAFEPEKKAITVKKGDVLRIKTNKHKSIFINVDLVKLDPLGSTYGYETYINNYSLQNPELDIDFEKLHWLDEEKLQKEIDNFPEAKVIAENEYEIKIDTSKYDDAYKDQLVGCKIYLAFSDLKSPVYVVGKNDSMVDYYFVFDIQD